MTHFRVTDVLAALPFAPAISVGAVRESIDGWVRARLHIPSELEERGSIAVRTERSLNACNMMPGVSRDTALARLGELASCPACAMLYEIAVTLGSGEAFGRAA